MSFQKLLQPKAEQWQTKHSCTEECVTAVGEMVVYQAMKTDRFIIQNA